MSMHNEVALCEIIKGWYLVTGEWNGNNWGLSSGNHPAFMFKDIPPINVTADMTDEQINDMPELAYQEHDNTFGKYADIFEEALHCSPTVGYSLVNGGLQSGYDPERHGSNFTMWLLNQIAWCLRAAKEVDAEN